LSENNPVDKEPAKLDFDPVKSILKIGTKNISLRKFKDQYHLLNVIFSNRSELFQEWFFSEIGEEIDKSSPYDDKKVYNITYQS
jgi:hypothetical protein